MAVPQCCFESGTDIATETNDVSRSTQMMQVAEADRAVLIYSIKYQAV